MSNGPSPKNINMKYVRSGHLIQRSPMKEAVDDRLNFDIYKQDSFSHRNHLLDIIQRKSLTRKSASRKPVSFRPNAKSKFRVGFGG